MPKSARFIKHQLTFPLLISKFQLPHLSTPLVQRERLLALLDVGRQRSMTLLIAPAGSGKTTLITQWLAARKADQESFPPVAWVSLEKNDNDLVRFWRYVGTACRAYQLGCEKAVLQQLATLSTFPPETSLLEVTLAHFLNDLTQSACEGFLVLDNYQMITSSHIHQTLAFFIEHLPPRLHLILITRCDPAFPLARLRARGALNEIGRYDLRFSQEETATFFQLCFPALQLTETIEPLDALLDGWATGIRLFALSLPRIPVEASIKQQLIKFVSGNHSLHDYFLEEILDAQTAMLQHFLLCTCLLSRLTATLCNVIMGTSDSAAILMSLEGDGLFLERLDGPGQWYCYQALFAETMRMEARRRLGEEEVRAILFRTSLWYEQEGLLTEAIELALQAQEPEYTATMIERYLAQRGFDDMHEFSTLRRWLEQVPISTLSQYPLLCLHYAQVLSLSTVFEQPRVGMFAQMDELLQMAETSWSAEGNTMRLGEVYAFRSYILMRREVMEQAYKYAKQALYWLPITSQHWRGVCLNLLGAGELSGGHLAQAKVLLQEALAIWMNLRHPHGERSCLLLLATLYLEQGALHLAADCYRRIIHEAREVGDREDLIPALLGLAQICYEWNDLETAEHVSLEACDISEQMGNQALLMRSTFILAHIWFIQDQKIHVRSRLASLLGLCANRPDLCAEIQLAQMHYWLAEGDITIVEQRLNALIIPVEASSHVKERREILQLRVLLARRKYYQISAELERLQETAQKNERGYILVEIQLLRARLLFAEKRVLEARQILSDILLFAHTEGYLRSFLDEGREIAALLHTKPPRQEDIPLQRYIHMILRNFGPDQEVPKWAMVGLEPLSRQEQRVLRLIIAELSYPEIACELTVSINTVKTQVNSIYRKLNVHSRREARAVVRDQRLFLAES